MFAPNLNRDVMSRKCADDEEREGAVIMHDERWRRWELSAAVFFLRPLVAPAIDTEKVRHGR